MLKDFRNLVVGALLTAILVVGGSISLLWWAEASIIFCALFILTTVGLLALTTRLLLNYRNLIEKHSLIIDSIDALPKGMFVLNGQNKFVFKNKPYEMFFHKNLSSNNVFQNLMDVIRRARIGSAAQETVNITDTKGDVLSYRLTASALKGHAGYITFSVGDVSGMIDRTNKEDMRGFLDKAPTGLFSINSSGDFL